MKDRYIFILPLIITVLVALPVRATAAKEVLIDVVLASVDGKPITLQDLEKRLPRAKDLSLQDLSVDPEVKLVLESLIMEQVILHEAEERKLGVSNSEIEEYIEEVARRNNLSRDGFEAALAAENKSLEDYKKVLKIDILKSKLTSSYVRGAVTVSDEEIDKYLETQPHLTKSGAKVKLSQILVTLEGKSEEDALEQAENIRALLKGGKNFAELAANYSEGREALEGGSLGIIAEEDLNPVIFDAIFSLSPGEISEITRTPVGFHLFRLDERLVDKSDSEGKNAAAAIREEVRQMLLSGKMQSKMNSFFTEDIYKQHTIDRKI